MRTLALSQDESEAVNVLLRTIGEESGFAQTPTLEGLLDLWKSFVEEIEKGYKLSIYDYTHDLTARDHLDEVLTALSKDESRRALRAALQPWDDRFRLATRAARLPISPGVRSTDRPWWFRLPRKLSGELEQDFRSEGFIDG